MRETEPQSSPEKSSGERRRAVSGAVWLILERVVSFAVSFGSGIVMARLLLPEDFGTVAFATSFYLIACRLAGIGVNAELIRADSNAPDYPVFQDTCFWLGAMLNVLIGIGVCLTALLTPWFTHTGALIACIVAGGWTISSLFDPCRSLMQKNLQFRRLTMLQWIPGTLGILGGVGLALADCGIWALAVPQMVMLALSGLLVLWLGDYRPSWRFDRRHARQILKGARFYLGNSLCEGAYQRIDNLAVGRFLGEASLGFYDRAYIIGGLFHQNLGSIITRLALPVFARRADNPAAAARLAGMILRLALYATFFATAFFCLYCPVVITFLWGSKWLAVAEVFRWLAPYSILLPALYITKDILIALGEVRQSWRGYLWVLCLICALIVPGMYLYGLNGAALTVDIALAAGLGQMAWRLRRVLPELSLWRGYIRPLVLSMAAFGLLFGIYIALPDAINWTAAGLLCLLWAGLFCAIMIYAETEALRFALTAAGELPPLRGFCNRLLAHLPEEKPVAA